MPIGLRPFANPTARDAPGDPICSAICPYDRVSPYGMVRNAAHTRRWNSVPSNSSVEVEFGEFAGEIRRQLLDRVGERVVVGRLPAGPIGLVGLVDHP